MSLSVIIKRLKQLFLLLLLGLFLFFANRFIGNDTSPYPYPYQRIKVLKSEALKAQAADVLIVGDQSAVNLKRFSDRFIKETAKHLKKPLILYNWARRGETLAQTKAKISSLKKLPTLTIYHGGSEEFASKRFHPPELPKMMKNIKKSRNDTLYSLSLTFPLFSRFVYTPVDRVSFSQVPSPHKDIYTPNQVQKILELHYTIYKQELLEFFDIFKEKDSKIWVIPSALNLERSPARTCQTSDDEKTRAMRQQVTKLIKERRYKEAKSLSVMLAQTTMTSAYDYHQLAKLLIKVGSYPQARRAFYQARMFDCGLRYSTPIHLKLLMEAAEKRNFTVLDFNRLVNNQLGRNKLFFDETTPQDLYYQKLIDMMIGEFKKFLKG